MTETNRESEKKGDETKTIPYQITLMYLPNIIGYARLVLFLASVFFILRKSFIGILFYWLSQLLDAFDGHFARKLNQTSNFGAIFDMTLDRTATIGLQMTIITFEPRLAMPFVFVATLDIMSHWYSTGLGYMTKSSHKSTDYGNWLMRLYYNNRYVLFAMCGTNETFYLGLASLYMTENEKLLLFIKTIVVLCLPFAVLKNIISYFQLKSSMISVAQMA